MVRLLLFSMLLLNALIAGAQKKKVLLPEAAYAERLTAALQQQEPAQYAALMPPPEVLDELQAILPRLLKPLELAETEVAADGYAKALARTADRCFYRMKAESDAMRLRWPSMRLARYELVKQTRTRDSLLEKQVPDRYKGYVFYLDQMRQKTFCILVKGLFIYKDNLYGGLLGRVFPAETIVAYEAHREAARKAAAKGEVYVAFQPTETEEAETRDSGSEDSSKTETPSSKGVVAERFYYNGYFDEEIPVRLFVRGYKGNCKEGVCRWNAIMQVGDEDDWVGLSMIKKDSSWVFTELPNKAVMELKPDKIGLLGNWNATDDDTGYEVTLTEKDLPKKKLAAVEAIMDGLGL